MPENQGEAGELDEMKDSADDNNELRQAVEKIRGYNELLDTYSLHQFIIRKGKALVETPEFISFQRKYAHMWGALKSIIGELESICADYDIATAYIDGQKMVKVAMNDVSSTRTIDDILTCVVNIDKVRSLMKLPGRRYHSAHERAVEMAATSIQSCWRGFCCYSVYAKRQLEVRSAKKMQQGWRIYQSVKETRERIAKQRAEDAAAWERMQSSFKERWPAMRSKRRIVVHVPSLSFEEHVRLATPRFAAHQNSQLARLCALGDPLVDVVYVAPFELPEDVMNYYLKLLAVSGIEEPEHRFRVIVPENVDRFPLPLVSCCCPDLFTSSTAYYTATDRRSRSVHRPGSRRRRG